MKKILILVLGLGLGLVLAAILALPAMAGIPTIAAARFSQYYYVGWSSQNTAIFNRGYNLNLTLDKNTGSGFRSFNRYIRGFVSSTIRLVPSYSAGVIVAFYMSSHRTASTTVWDELDFEFLGNVTGQPWILQTNVYINGKADREHRTYLWFDPTTTFHTYSLLWTPNQIIWYVDKIPIRIYRRTPASRSVYPTSRPMAVYGSIWNGDDWATRGGLDKINFTYAPFTATFSRFQIDACAVQQPSVWPPCFANTTSFWWSNYTLSDSEKRSYTAFTKRYTIYNYCNDKGRFRIQPPECGIPPW